MKMEKFLNKYRIEKDAFEKTELNWDDLLAIKGDFEKAAEQLGEIGKTIANTLVACSKVHSVKYRTKDPDHLIEKIIRQKRAEPEFDCTIENYFTKITDLVGVRPLHLFKEDWAEIHDFVTESFELVQPPVANVRKGDPDEFIKDYEDRGCKLNEHKFGYRSVHYLVKTAVFKRPTISEIQVRTIFEEGWSEIDHRIRYPYDQENPILLPYLTIFNRLAGSADEMGSYILHLSNHIDKLKTEFQKQVEMEKEKRKQLEQEIEQLKVDRKDKEALKKRLLEMEAAARLSTGKLFEYKMPEIRIPKYEMPKIKMPKYEMPKIKIPKIEIKAPKSGDKDKDEPEE